MCKSWGQVTGNSLNNHYAGLVNKQRCFCIVEYYTATQCPMDSSMSHELGPTARQDGHKGTSSAVACLLLTSSCLSSSPQQKDLLPPPRSIP